MYFLYTKWEKKMDPYVEYLGIGAVVYKQFYAYMKDM